ncbi:nuclear transport factor 2 family protein [Natrarchaeobius chitinivorans]|uniref:Nuclear transport factor 2 family protein n=1 Tax=Natrarchaeobius chitinivorans TaxID=1679083 RepID=A0A3N6MPN4_NATCH|nr:nuclear transport factor 2 family protein [Natrarchaeobius chitinivorans]RQG96486.1 nuclear transport factor 2 family protein [Natrarchaeobius chitinivorans]
MDSVDIVERYYDALDEHEYDALEELLAPGFVQRRPDRTFADRDSFVEFMREDRPNPDTTHELVSIVDGGETVAARGRVLESRTQLFEFADFFELEDGRIVELETYSR